MAEWQEADEICFDLLNIIARIVNSSRDKVKRKKRAFDCFEEIEIMYGAIDSYVRMALLTIANTMYKREDSRSRDDHFDMSFVNGILSTADPVTGYIYDNESNRRREKLKEAVTAVFEKNTDDTSGFEPVQTLNYRDTEPQEANISTAEIDTVFKRFYNSVALSVQQFAINVTDKARAQSFKENAVARVKWNAIGDERTCEECMEHDGKVYKLTEVPDRHIRCRCWLEPVKN